MKHEHVYHNYQYLWDMKILNLIKEGKCQELDIMPDFIEQAMAAFTWLMGALGIPDYPGTHSYGSVIEQECRSGMESGMERRCAMSAVVGLILPGLPHPLLQPQGNPSWGEIRKGFEVVRQQLIDAKIERLVLYSTQWFSILGHQVQAHANPEWTHVDQEFHHLGSMPYSFNVDTDFSESVVKYATKRGLTLEGGLSRFPIDTVSVVVNNLLNHDNRFELSIVSCNMYADRAETVVG